MKRLLFALLLGGTMPAALAQTAPAPSAMPAPAAAQISAAADFLPLAAANNRFEILSSRLALEKTGSSEIRAFAQKMLDDHGAAASRLEEAASLSGVALPENESRQHLLDELAASSGEAFDTLYAQMQIQAHDEAVALFQGFSQAGEPGPARDLAEAMLPALQEHQAMAAGMSRT